MRPVEASDLELVLNQRHEMFIEMGFEPGACHAAIEANRDLFRTALADGRYRGFFAVDNSNRVVAGGGIISHQFHTGPLDASRRRSWIVNVYTEPSHRRRGLARMVMQALLNLCRELGWTAVLLHASSDGRPLYDSLGFKATNEMILKLRQ